MWHRIIVEIEADIGRLADLDDDALYQRVWVVRQSQQLGRFLGEGVADADIALSRTSPIRRHAAAPSVSLSIEVIQINKFAGREEARADVLNRSLNPAFPKDRQLHSDPVDHVQRFRVTHPFHPLYGREFILVDRRTAW